MTLHEYVVARLIETRGRWPRIAAETGVSLRTLEKIARREIADPGVSHVQKLLDYFERPRSAA